MCQLNEHRCGDNRTREHVQIYVAVEKRRQATPDLLLYLYVFLDLVCAHPVGLCNGK